MKKIVIAVCFFVVVIVALIYRVGPRTIARERGPNGEIVSIVEIPAGDLVSLLTRDNPRYRFEYRLSDGYLWSAFSFRGESFYPRIARVKWASDTRAECDFDGYVYGVVENRLWTKGRE